MKPEFSDNAGCEHCGDLEPFTMTFPEDGTDYCSDCWESLGENRKIKPAWKAKETKAKIKYFKARLDELYEQDPI